MCAGSSLTAGPGGWGSSGWRGLSPLALGTQLGLCRSKHTNNHETAWPVGKCSAERLPVFSAECTIKVCRAESL